MNSITQRPKFWSAHSITKQNVLCNNIAYIQLGNATKRMQMGGAPKLNIAQVYLQHHGQFIILISGLSGTRKSLLASNFARDFKFKLIKLDDFAKPDNNIIVELEGIQVTDWDHVDSYDWDAFNAKIDSIKKEGLVICGNMFPSSKLKFSPDIHIHTRITKQTLITVRHETVAKHPEKYADLVKILDTPTEKLIINKIVFPHYLEYSEQSKFDLQIQADAKNDVEMYDETYDFVINFIKNYNEKEKLSIRKMLSNDDKKVEVSSSAINESDEVNTSDEEETADDA